MIKQMLTGAALGLVLASGAAQAQGAGDDAGPLTARDVIGKRLLDGNGVLIGHIESADAQAATVTTPDHKHIKVQLAALSLGFGPHTVIEDANGQADQLNADVDSKLQ